MGVENQPAPGPSVLEELARLRDDTLGFIRYLKALGVRQAPVAAVPEMDNPFADSLERVQGELAGCARCPLSQDRTHLLPGSGAGGGLMVIGLAPTPEEDKSGKPFQGPAGGLLADVLEKGLRLDRGEVFYTHMVKCRPRAALPPRPEEAAVCRAFLDRQIATARPRMIMALGRHAAGLLTGLAPDAPGLLHRFHQLDGVVLMPTLDLEEILAQPSLKRPLWEDIKKMLARL